MNKLAIVTGAASGLGYEFSKLLAQKKYKVVLIDIDANKLEIVSKELKNNFQVETLTLVKDLSKPDISEEIMRELDNETISILINNAGFGLYGKFAETPWEREYAMLQVHVLTTTHLTKLIVKKMIANGSGHILNVTSLAAFQPGPLMCIYYATKAYILSFSEAIGNELKGTGVTVTALCPGPTKTAFQQTISQQANANKISFNMASATAVATYGINAMFQGKAVAIPGFFNVILAHLPRILPRKITLSIIRKIQEKNRG